MDKELTLPRGVGKELWERATLAIRGAWQASGDQPVEFINDWAQSLVRGLQRDEFASIPCPEARKLWNLATASDFWKGAAIYHSCDDCNTHSSQFETAKAFLMAVASDLARP